MSNKEKILEIVGLAVDIQSKQHAGEVGEEYPYVNVSPSNFVEEVTVTVNDTGFIKGGIGNCTYTFCFNDVVERTYQNCRKHLTELFDKCI